MTNTSNERITARLDELKAERNAFQATAEAQASARLEAVRQGLMVEIQVRLEMYERMVGELQALAGETDDADQ